ncbi:hypothetical protein B296_00008070 [Ensete ventricosum]|uniref:Uncharacterized protein n=1 Tax=Ensete ventricosum TaxID=4639 RepID=A0A426XUG7_ENSVE|nr:hypothetical protein B296_00008070 [Ensete ventricosum]
MSIVNKVSELLWDKNSPTDSLPLHCAPFFLPYRCIVRCHCSQSLPCNRDPLPLLDSTLSHLPIASSTCKQQQTKGLSTSSDNDLVDDVVQLRLSSADRTYKIGTNLPASSLLPLLVKLAKVLDRECTLVAPSSLDVGTAPVLPSQISVNYLRDIANAATTALCVPTSSSTSPAEVILGSAQRALSSSCIAVLLHLLPYHVDGVHCRKQPPTSTLLMDSAFNLPLA